MSEVESLLHRLDALEAELNVLEQCKRAQSLPGGDYESRRAAILSEVADTENRLRVLAEKSERAASELRTRVYRDPAAQLVITGFLDGSLGELTPVFDADRMPRYPIVENILGGDPAVSLKLLQRMADLCILSKRFYEKVFSCPRCGQPSQVFLHYKCPKCGETDIELTKLLQHVCGSIYREDAFKGGEPYCRKCEDEGRQARGGFQVMGIVFICHNCQAHFDQPPSAFYCRGCGLEFSLLEARPVNAYSYTLNGELAEEMRMSISLPILRGALEGLGYAVQAPGLVLGSSGVTHDFSLGASRGGETIVLDLVEAGGEVDVTGVLVPYGKFVDAKPARGILIAIPGLTAEAKTFANSSGMTYVEGKSVREIAERLKSILEKPGRGGWDKP